MIADSLWLGDYNYLRNLFGALEKLPSDTITPVIFLNHKTQPKESDFPSAEIVRTSLLDRKSLLAAAQGVGEDHEKRPAARAAFPAREDFPARQRSFDENYRRIVEEALLERDRRQV